MYLTEESQRNLYSHMQALSVEFAVHEVLEISRVSLPQTRVGPRTLHGLAEANTPHVGPTGGLVCSAHCLPRYVCGGPKVFAACPCDAWQMLFATGRTLASRHKGLHLSFLRKQPLEAATKAAVGAKSYCYILIGLLQHTGRLAQAGLHLSIQYRSILHAVVFF